MIKVKFWGVRGSIPCPGFATAKYGGNTLCLELRFNDANRMIIIDAGSGIRSLGNYLAAHDIPKGMKKIDIYLTHTHWDHILGFPFFTPMYIPGMRIRIHGPQTFGDDSLESVIGGQFVYRYFPVRIEELSSVIEYSELGEGRFDLGDGITLVTKFLNHPISCIGYRFEYRGKSFATVYDAEPFQNLFCTDPTDPSYDKAVALEGEKAAAEQNMLVERFFAGADCIVYDAQYTEEEYRNGKRGWGHGAIEYAIDATARNGVAQLALIHHDPERTDAQLDILTEKLCNREHCGDMKACFAREGMEITL